MTEIEREIDYSVVFSVIFPVVLATAAESMPLAGVAAISGAIPGLAVTLWALVESKGSVDVILFSPFIFFPFAIPSFLIALCSAWIYRLFR